MKTFPGLSFALLALAFVAGCKTNPPQIAGKWHGSTQLTATYMTAISGKPRTENVPADFVLLLTQNGQTIRGDASITAAKNPPIHIPINSSVVGSDVRISLEGDASSTFAHTHLSFDGKADNSKISGGVNVVLNNMSGSAQNRGSLTLEPVK
jgi:hypothetical protein